MIQTLRPNGQDELARVLTAWRSSPASHQFEAPADEPRLTAAERDFGRPMPEALKALYRFSDGMAALGGNLIVEPLTALIGFADRLRDWGWPVPDEVLVFGNNGAGDQFGAWYPAGAPSSGPTPVVMIGSVFEPSSLALAGTDLPRFLLAWSGYYLVLDDAPTEALDALGLPASLRKMDEDAGLAPYFRWADPGLADPQPDPYERGMDAAAIGELLTQH